MVTVRCRGYVGSGRSVESVVRSWYGRDAVIQWSDDPNSPDLGVIARPADLRSNPIGAPMRVLDTLIEVREN